MLQRRPFIGILVDGVVVADVWPGSPGDRAGVAPGDRIATVDRDPFTGDPAGLTGSRRPGDTLRLEVHGKGSVTVALDPWPDELTPGAATEYGEVTAGGVRLRTITVIPDANAGVGVLFLPGLNAGSLDLALTGDGPWRRIVTGLAAAGIASMRVERRGHGDSEGTPDADFITEVEGYVAGARALSDRVDRIALFGHSVGGMQAPLLAREVPVERIAVYGTTATRWSDNMVPLLRRQLTCRGVDGSALQDALDRETRLAALIAGDDPTDLTHLGGRSVDYLRQLDRAAVADAWSAFGGDVLVIDGEHDLVTPRQDHDALAARLPCATRQTLRGLGHTMLEVPDPLTDLERPGQGSPSSAVAEALAPFFLGATR